MRCSVRRLTPATWQVLLFALAITLSAGRFVAAQQPPQQPQQPQQAAQQPRAPQQPGNRLRPGSNPEPARGGNQGKPAKKDHQANDGNDAAFDQKLAQLGLHPKKGPATCDLGPQATIAIPPDFFFLPKSDMSRFAQITQNIHDPNMLGVVAPNDGDWLVFISYEDSGHVSDDEKDKLDADAILSSIKEGTAQGNEERRRQGWDTLEVVGWDKPPFYDPQSHNLVWAIRGRSKEGDSINYNSRVLGRTGVASLNLVIAPDKLQMTLPTYNALISKFAYKPDRGYSEFRAGDKVAAYGLTALVAGGAVALAAKSGFLAKFGKLIIVGALAFFGAIGAAFKKLARLFGGGTSQPQA